MKSKVWFWIAGLFVLALVITAAVIYYYSGVSADSVEALKGTKIQLVDADGKTVVQRAIPIKLVFNGTIRSCKVVRVFGAKYSKCKTVNKTFSGVTVSDETGAYTVSTSSYRSLTNEELQTVAKSTLEEKLGRKLTTQEILLIHNIVRKASVVESPTSDQIKKIVDAQIKSSGNLTIAKNDVDSIVDFFVSPMFSLALQTGKEYHGFQLLNVVASVDTTVLSSDSQTISFYTDDYKSSVNLVVDYKGAELIAAAKNYYFAEIDKSTASESDKTVAKTSITDFADYVSFYVVHIADLTEKSSEDIATKASELVKKTLTAVNEHNK